MFYLINIIKIFLLIIICIDINSMVTANNQVISQIEYYIDKDINGFGNEIQVDMAQGNELDLNFDVDLTGLKEGVHVLYIRAKDDNNNWSLTQSRPFYVSKLISNPQIVQIEYYLDKDIHGFGNETQLEPILNKDNINFVVDLCCINSGVHTLYVRAKDSNGNWSLIQKRTFFVYEIDAGNKIIQIEYFFNTDLGYGKGTQVYFTPQDDVILNIDTNLFDLSSGNNHLYIRAKDNKGKWSLLSTKTLELEEPPVKFFFPKNGETLIKDRSYILKWDHHYIEGTINIDLYRGDNKVIQLAEEIPNTGNYIFHLSKALLDGNDYRFCIQNQNNRYICDSFFSLKSNSIDLNNDGFVNINDSLSSLMLFSNIDDRLYKIAISPEIDINLDDKIGIEEAIYNLEMLANTTINKKLCLNFCKDAYTSEHFEDDDGYDRGSCGAAAIALLLHFLTPDNCTKVRSIDIKNMNDQLLSRFIDGVWVDGYGTYLPTSGNYYITYMSGIDPYIERDHDDGIISDEIYNAAIRSNAFLGKLQEIKNLNAVMHKFDNQIETKNCIFNSLRNGYWVIINPWYDFLAPGQIGHFYLVYGGTEHSTVMDSTIDVIDTFKKGSFEKAKIENISLEKVLYSMGHMGRLYIKEETTTEEEHQYFVIVVWK
ncbi:hypothetical protein MHK_006947 [Candidatus Magnetomorum sp. HK-1]|nr:hypothetical protein MHK_006947 [Candidatus Magnetomorum sp. HK-1]